MSKKREDDDILKSTQVAWAVVLAKACDEDLKDDAVMADVAEVLVDEQRNHAFKEIEKAFEFNLQGCENAQKRNKSCFIGRCRPFCVGIFTCG